MNNKRVNKVLIIGFILITLISCYSKTDNTNNRIDNDTTKVVEKISESTLIEYNSIKESNSKLKKEVKVSSKIIPEKTIYDNFEVVYLDFHENRLQRVFVTIDTSKIYDASMIQSIVCEIQTLFDINKKSNISFFSEKKYADYKTNLFVNEEGRTSPIEEYYNWMNYYYLAEYEFETNEYKIYPSCRKDYKRQKTIKIICK